MNGTDEEFVPEDETEQGPALVKRLRERLKKAIEEKQEYLDGWQRARADFANFKKEEAIHLTAKEERLKSDMLEVLIPTLDSFESALKHGANKDVEMIYKQFLGGLRELGVEQYGKIGDLFDPYKYEALEEVATDDKKLEHVVAEVKRSGYSVGEKIIRPAQVVLYAVKN